MHELSQSETALHCSIVSDFWAQTRNDPCYPVLANPVSDLIHAGVSDIKYTNINRNVQIQIATCRMLAAPVSTDIDLNVGCAYGLFGQYVYVSLLRGSTDDGYIELYNVGVSMIGK